LIEIGVLEADIIGASGTRLDHTLANMMILFKYESRIKLAIIDANNRLFVGEHSMLIEKGCYKYLSLMPISGTVTGVTLEGVTYPLVNHTLIRESTFAVSNEISGDSCHLSYDSGQLLVIQSRD